MTEAQFQTKFSHWLRHVWPVTGAFELKVCDGALRFCDVVEHQRDALLAVKQGLLTWKIPDLGAHNPFDCFALKQENAYIVVLYRNTKNFYLIDIEDFLLLERQFKRKSLTEVMAQKYADSVGKLK